jgi:hypothetical protein
MTDFAIHPPVHLTSHPDEPIRSLEAAERYVKRHMEGRVDAGAVEVIRRLESVRTSEEADAAGQAFKQWASHAGLLLVPPEDRH